MTDLQGALARALADRYQIQRELGQGGMSTVYLALDLKHNRNVALKVLETELAAVLGAGQIRPRDYHDRGTPTPPYPSLIHSGHLGRLSLLRDAVHRGGDPSR
jgi:serine/threonine-protein kinase